jgi:deaminated glutathione amidase
MTLAGLRIAAVQLTSTNDVEANLARVELRVREAAARGAKVVVLPENFAFMGGSDEERRAVAETLPGDGPIVTRLRTLAQDLSLFVIAGGMPERADDAERPHNSCAVFAPWGDLVSVYRKIHLFDVDVADGQVYRESNATTAGAEPKVVDVYDTKVGLSVCYDLRFPELYRKLVDLGAQVLVVPAAFTLMTGKDHWHVLLRARAIENQCFVVAAAQGGTHPKGRMTYGKSLVVDPWGDVIAQASDGEGVLVADLDLGRVEAVREKLPSLRHRRLG